MAADPEMTADFDKVNANTGEDNNEGEDEPELPGEVKKLILDDQFWMKIESLFEILQPIVICLTEIESDDLIMHRAHEVMIKMFTTVESLAKSSPVFDARDKVKVQKCVKERKNMMMHPIMLAAAILDPAGMGSDLSEEEAMDGVNFIFESARKFKFDEEAIMTQLTNYRAKADIWSKQFVWVSVKNVKPTVWWKSFFGHTVLGQMAEKILTCPLTSAATERSFKTFGNVHTKKRNRLTTERSGKITFIAHNDKLMREKKEKEPAAKRLRYNETDSASSDEDL